MRGPRTMLGVGLVAFASAWVYADTPQRDEALVQGEYLMSLRKLTADARPSGPARP